MTPIERSTTGATPSSPTAATRFGEIMRRAVAATPGAVGGAFADRQGELIDGFTLHHTPHAYALLAVSADPVDWIGDAVAALREASVALCEEMA